MNSSRALASLGDAWLFLRILSFAMSVPLLLRLRLPWLERLLRFGIARATPAPADVQKILSTVETVQRSGRPFVRRGCLVRGLTLYYFLSRAGMDVSLSFGIGPHDDGFAGHCWLVKDGEPYLETEDPRPRYSTMYSIPHEDNAASGEIVAKLNQGFRG